MRSLLCYLAKHHLSKPQLPPASPLNWLLVDACPWLLYTLSSSTVSVGHQPPTRMRTSTHLLSPEPLGFTHLQELTTAFVHETPHTKHIYQFSAANCYLGDTMLRFFYEYFHLQSPSPQDLNAINLSGLHQPTLPPSVLLSPRGDGVWKAKLCVPSTLPAPH